jgi:hypothetical protein
MNSKTVFSPKYDLDLDGFGLDYAIFSGTYRSNVTYENIIIDNEVKKKIFFLLTKSF